MPALSPDAPRVAQTTVGIRPCAFGHGHRAWLSRYRRFDTKLQDLPLVIWEALRQRYAAQSSIRPDLEFIPWPCLLHTRSTVSPRLGSFTVFSGAWASFALELFEDSRVMCSAAPNCSSSKLRGIAVLSIERPSYLLSWPGAPQQTPTIVASRLAAFAGSGNGSFQIPYPTSEHFDGARGMPAAPELAKRTALVALVANTVLEIKPRAGSTRSEMIGRGPLRARLHADCRNAPPGICIARGGPRGASQIWNSNNATFQAYQSSIFCLQPWGDSATRKGFWDALLAGCINVIMNDAGWNETDAWFGDHREWTLRMPLDALSNAGGVIGYLRAVPRPTVERLHAAVRSVRGRVQYAIESGTPGGDGVDTIVQNVARHFRGLRASGDRPNLHSGDRACRTIIGHICRQIQTVL